MQQGTGSSMEELKERLVEYLAYAPPSTMTHVLKEFDGHNDKDEIKVAIWYLLDEGRLSLDDHRFLIVEELK